MEDMKRIIMGVALITVFVVWTMLIQFVDVQAIGVNGTLIGFATFNGWFHKLTGVHMTLYVVTDWLGLVPVFVCMFFGGVGFIQLLKRRSLLKVDLDIIFLGVYYILVIFGYLIFEMIPINYRPVLIEGFMEASYPSSTTLLVLSVMPTLVFQANKRLKSVMAKRIIVILAILFSVFMVIGRLICGVHWFTDIVGSVILSAGLFCIYRGIVLMNWRSDNGIS
jgi:undecaprenyl-diphosphatase